MWRMDVSENGIQRLRNGDGDAELHTPVSALSSGGGFGFCRKRKESGNSAASPVRVRAGGMCAAVFSGCRRVWRIAKRARTEYSVDDSCVHGRIVKAVVRNDDSEKGTRHIDAQLGSWKSVGVALRKQLRSGDSEGPWQFMYFERGDWVEYLEETNSVVWDSFRAGSLTAEITVGMRAYLLNFTEMTQVNVATGYVRSIAWIDDAWEMSLPSNPIACPSSYLQSLGKSWGVPELRDRVNRHCVTWRDGATDSISGFMLGSDGAQGSQSEHIDDTGNASCDYFGRGTGDTEHGIRGITTDAFRDYEFTKLTLGGHSGALSQSEQTDVKPALEEKSTNLGISSGCSSFGERFVMLKDGNKEFNDVKSKFLSGFGKLAGDTMITGIRRDSSPTALARQEAFERQKALIEQTRGNANVRYGWHGTSKKGVAGIFLHGFGQPLTPKNGSTYGVGVYLAVEAFVSAVYADKDENGEHHVVLCQVIAGASELVKPPSEQFHPSSEHFDTGVDDLLAPKRLIVWSTHMNTHILPLYVVSFKLPPRWHRMMAELYGKHKGSMTFRQEAPVEDPYFIKQTCGMAEALRNRIMGCTNHRQGPTSAFIRFPHLFALLQRLLTPEQRLVLKNCYAKFEAGSMSRGILVQELQKMVGRDCLIHAIQMCQGFQGCQANSDIKAQ